jgi:hypothetical protein
MYLVAITRWGPSLDTELAHLADALGEASPDLRRRLTGPLPAVLARVEDVGRASQLLSMLRGRGHGAVACDEDSVARSEAMLSPSSYRFEADGISVSHPSRATQRMQAAGIAALVVATTTVIERSVDVEKTKKFSAGRALLTGGLVMRKRHSRTTESSSEAQERVLFVIGEDGDPLRFAETKLNHDGLGQRMQPTAALNFATLVNELRRLAPQALFDDRLVKESRFRRMNAPQASGDSNVWNIDLHMHLLVSAHVTGQL